METLQDGLKVEAVRVLAGVGSVLGSLVSANSNGFIVTHHAGDEELKVLREHGKVDKAACQDQCRWQCDSGQRQRCPGSSGAVLQGLRGNSSRLWA